MLETVFLSTILILFILSFGLKNVLTFLKTKKSIRGTSIKLSLSIILSTCIYILILIRLFFGKINWLFEVILPFQNYLKYVGYILIILGFLVGLLALIEMKSSWRIGIKYNQKTTLITTGIYKISRNPYFFSYTILIFGYLLIFPSIFILFLYVFLIVIFHRMILAEEIYLAKIQGDEYRRYKMKVNRYLTLKI